MLSLWPWKTEFPFGALASCQCFWGGYSSCPSNWSRKSWAFRDIKVSVCNLCHCMSIVFDSLMTAYGSRMCLISIRIKGSHVRKARMPCNAALKYECCYNTCLWTWSENHNRCEKELWQGQPDLSFINFRKCHLFIGFRDFFKCFKHNFQITIMKSWAPNQGQVNQF